MQSVNGNWRSIFLLGFLLGAGGLCLACTKAPQRADDAMTQAGGDLPGDTGVGASGTTGASTGPFPVLCYPGEVRCSGQAFLETCAPTGQEWVATACGPNATCVPCEDDDTCTVDQCVGPCDIEADLPSSAGCSFVASRQLHPYEDWADGLVMGNPSVELTATVTVYFTPEGEREEEVFAGPLVLPPGTSDYVLLSTAFVPGTQSRLRTGGIYRISSDAPVIAYQHSPLFNNRGNESSMLLPDTALGRNYVVSAYPSHPGSQGAPSYFVVVAVEDGTTVRWTPPVPTGGDGVPIPQVDAGETGTLKLNRFDTLRIVPSTVDTPLLERDLSGTVIASDKPVWVMGAVRCAPTPIPEDYVSGTCDPLQEVLFPLEHWGRKYVAAAAPVRGTEYATWRVYAGNDGVTVTSDPPIPELPHTFAKRGDYLEFKVPGGQHLVLEGDGAFMPVQYLQARYTNTASGTNSDAIGAPGSGDPSMVQMVPVEQFLERYTFVTGLDFASHYATIIRRRDGADVTIDGTVVSDYANVGDYDVAHVLIEEGAHLTESEEPFGLIQVGFSQAGEDPNCTNNVGADDDEQVECNSSYAYPGGMKTEQIFVP